MIKVKGSAAAWGGVEKGQSKNEQQQKEMQK
jgi:hypothetical protein